MIDIFKKYIYFLNDRWCDEQPVTVGKLVPMFLSMKIVYDHYRRIDKCVCKPFVVLGVVDSWTQCLFTMTIDESMDKTFMTVWLLFLLYKKGYQNDKILFPVHSFQLFNTILKKTEIDVAFTFGII